MIRTAYLRVYVPATAAGAWDDHRSRTGRVVRSSDRFLWVEPVEDDAFHAEWNGRSYVCPREARLRMYESLLAFTEAHPGAAELLVPTRERRRAESRLHEIRSDRPAARSHILASPWHVPLRWFAAFEPEEREIVQRGESTSLRYRTDVAGAAARIERSIEILEGAGFNDGVIDPVRELLDWLNDFEGDSMLELDYASVAELFDTASLVLDETAAEMGESLDALSTGDFERAGAFYAAAARRWAPAQALLYAN